MYEGLVEYAVGDGGLVPGVALKWTISKNQKIYVFHLRKTARWSDGSSVTAADFRRSWLRLLDSSHRFLIVNSYSVFKEALSIVEASRQLVM